MQELKDKIQAGLGRNLIGREVDGIHRLVKEHGTPEIEVGPPRFPGDKQRPVRLTWMVDGQPMPLLIQATAPPEKPRNMVREHLERQARERPGTFVTERSASAWTAVAPLISVLIISRREVRTRGPHSVLAPPCSRRRQAEGAVDPLKRDVGRLGLRRRLRRV